jgi:hypothetical protein
MGMDSPFKDGIHSAAPKGSAQKGAEKAPGTPSAGGGSSSGKGVSVVQVAKLPTSANKMDSPFNDRVK